MWTFDQPVVRLGRMPDSDVVFDAHADLDASGRHAEISQRGDQWIVRDAGSRNGTFVNGERVEERLLRDGDVVECGYGGPRIRIELVPPRQASATPSANTEAVPIARPDAPTGVAQAMAPYVDESTEPSFFADSSTGPMQGGPWGGPPAPAPAPPSVAPPVAPAGPPPSAPPPPASAPAGGEKRYGQATVGMMVDDALQGLRDQQARTQRKWKIAAGVLAALVGVVCLVVAVALLLRPKPGPAPDIAALSVTNAPALWRLQDGSGAVFCTAFAVRRDLLATSGRCVMGIESRQTGGGTVQVVGEGGTLDVSRMWRHPQTPTTPEATGIDIGLVEIAGAAPALVTLSTPPQVAALRPGTTLLAHGQSAAGALALPVTLTDTEGALSYAGAAPYGAPLLDASGMVVGVHTGPATAAVGPGQGTRVDGLLGLLAGLGR